MESSYVLAPPALSLTQSKLGPKLLDPSSLLAQALAISSPKRPRGEKKPIPDNEKDDRYFERRKRNNLAAKKSRDQRKLRENAIALRATFLEKENANLRMHVLVLREERNSLQGLILRRQLHQKQKAMLSLVVEQQQKQMHLMELLKLRHQSEEEETAVVDLSTKSTNMDEMKVNPPEMDDEDGQLTIVEA